MLRLALQTTCICYAAAVGLVKVDWISVNDPSAGSPTETLLRLLLPLSVVVYLISRMSTKNTQSKRFTGTLEIGRSDGRCVQRAGT
jgi:hypothetical protein